MLDVRYCVCRGKELLCEFAETDDPVGGQQVISSIKEGGKEAYEKPESAKGPIGRSSETMTSRCSGL